LASRHAALGSFLRAVAPAEPRSDARLLADFYAHRDEAAFAILVKRHQRAVWGVCCRLLHNLADAEDAFQATFVVLARSGKLLADRGSVGGWLYRVAERVARKARTMAISRTRREKRTAKPEAVPPQSPDDLFDVVADELGKLPENHRLAVALCDLEGLSRADAAERLGWAEGTLSARLHRGRKELGERLRARGVTASAVALAAVFATASAVPARTLSTTAKLAGVVSQTGLTDRVVPPGVAALASHTTREMAMKITTKALAAVALTAGLIGFGWVGVGGVGEPRATAAPVPAEKKEEKVELPQSAIPLLNNRRVLRELKCTPEQRVAIEDGFDDAQDAVTAARKRGVAQYDAAMQANGGKPNAQAEKVVADLQATLRDQSVLGTEAVKKLAEKTLKAEQLRRLVQIDRQVRWAELFSDEKTQDEIGLTAEQKKQMGELLDAGQGQFQKQKFFVAPVGGQGAVMPSVAGNPQFAKVKELLTEPQLKAWGKLTGEPIDFDKLNLAESMVYDLAVGRPAVVAPPPAPPKAGK
jgi:RNA polymerase sigma factor (sigma-70 family)